MVYIVGINDHCYQAINPKNNPYETEFRDYLLKQVQMKKINHISEEMNDELLRSQNDAQESVCRKIVEDLGLTHTMCEPTGYEKQQIGYVDKPWEDFLFEADTNEKVNAAYFEFHKNQWHIRENFWCEKLEPYSNEKVLFICGAQHPIRFSKLLTRRGIKSRIVCKRWKPKM